MTRRERKIAARLARLAGKPETRRVRRARWAARGHERPMWVGELIHEHRRMYLPWQTRAKQRGQNFRPRERYEKRDRMAIGGLPTLIRTVHLAKTMLVRMVGARRTQER